VFGRTAAGGGTVYTDSSNPSALSDSHKLSSPFLMRLNAMKQYKHGRPNWEVASSNPSPKFQYLLLLLPLTAIEFLLGGSSPYTSTDKTNKNKYT
jgi:hypothetical protein